MSQLDDWDSSPMPQRRPQHASRVPDEVGEGIQRRLAAMTARSKSLRHACDATATTDCTHPNHRRDADSLLSTDARFPGVLDMLGLDHTLPDVTEAERRTYLTWIGQSGPPDEGDLAA